MAERRMVSYHIVESDAFLDMSVQAQVLYFHLIMNADNRGYVPCVKRLLRQFDNFSIENIKELINSKFILERDRGLFLIKHWYMHNDIPRKVKEESTYLNDLENIYFDENYSYTTNVTEKNVKGFIQEGRKKTRKENKKENKKENQNQNQNKNENKKILNNTQSNYIESHACEKGDNDDYF